MTNSITVKFDAQKTSTLFHQYDEQQQPQDAFISLDYRNGDVDADWNGAIGGGVPADVYNGLVERISIPQNVKTEALAEFLESEYFCAKAAQLISLNEHGDEDQDRIEICGNIAGYIAENVALVEMWSAGDWLEGCTSEKDGCFLVGDHKIDAATSDEKIMEISHELENEIDEDENMIYDSIQDHLESLRDELSE